MFAGTARNREDRQRAKNVQMELEIYCFQSVAAEQRSHRPAFIAEESSVCIDYGDDARSEKKR
jgi:hypothetical protein